MFAIAMTSCKKDIETFIPNEISPADFGQMINADFSGEILDENGNPLQNVEITVGAKKTITDENGVFIVRDASVEERKAYLKATKTGYFNGSRTMIVQEGKLHFATIQLLEKITIGTFETAAGGAVDFEGVKLNFPANGIKLKSGGTYTGQVNVAAKYLDPTADETVLRMPGDLRGLNDKNEEFALATFGMMAVELTGAGGEELQVADDSEVEVRTPVPASYLGAAPATIPLWHFDEEVGMWIEEGSAILEGNEYVGTVSHFSFWNHDFPYPLVDIKGQIVDEDGNPLPNVQVKINVVDEKFYGYGNTNDDGFFCGLIPKDYDLEITVYGSGPCSQSTLYQELIGPFSDDVTLPTIVVTDDPGNLITATVTGRLVDCDGNPVSNGYIRGTFNRAWLNIFVEADGTFEYTGTFCDLTDDLEIQGYDMTNAMKTDELTYTVAANIQTGDLEACDMIDFYIKYILDGNPEVLIPDVTMGPDTISGGSSSIYGYLSQNQFINFSVDAVDITGTFPITEWAGSGGVSTLNVDGLYENRNSTVMVTITRFDSSPDSGVVIGTFSGEFTDVDPGGTHTISGSFRAQRK